MRDPARIMPMCVEMAVKWQDKCPDWRFLQLMNNFLGWLNLRGYMDGFYLEDEKMMELFNQYMEGIKNGYHN